eukprot:11225969-Prorocentrum_lima.AAC.1
MTSSLVGSEMCIRDSVRKLVSGLPHTTWLVRRLLKNRWEHGNEPSAVSYTHLTLPTICSV